MKKILAALLLVLLGYGGVVGYFYARQDALIFPRTVGEVAAPSAAKNPNMEVLTLETPDGATLHGLLLPAFDTPPGFMGNPTLILAFAGNKHDVVGFVTFLKNEVFPHQNVAVAGYSYRGYPNAMGMPSTGTPTEENLEADALRAYDAVVARIHPGRVQVIGYSLGTAIATYVAQQRPVSDLVLVAPFASMTEQVKSMYGFLPVDALLKYPFDTKGRLKEMAARPNHPTLTIFYGHQDGYIPNQQAFELLKVYPGARLLTLDGLKHGDILNHEDLPADLRRVMK